MDIPADAQVDSGGWLYRRAIRNLWGQQITDVGSEAEV